jgi:hypothetical protein
MVETPIQREGCASFEVSLGLRLHISQMRLPSTVLSSENRAAGQEQGYGMNLCRTDSERVVAA